MTRLLSILRLFWSTSVAAEMEYRLNFVLALITSLAQTGGTIFTIGLFYRGAKTLGGYAFEQAMLIAGTFLLLDGLANSLMRPNLSRIIQHVRDGTLDFVLLKPIDSQFWLSLRNCSPWGVPGALCGLGVILFYGSRLGLGPADYLLGLPVLLMGMIILYSLWYMLGTLAVWFVKIPNVTHVLYQLLEAGRFPITAYPLAYRLFFTFVIPVAFLTTFPADMMLGRENLSRELRVTPWTITVGSAVLAAMLLTASRCFWRFSLRFYTSASS